MYGKQQQVETKLPNVSQILNGKVQPIDDNASMNGTQPLPPISTVAGRFGGGSMPFPVSLPNFASIAVPFGDDGKANAVSNDVNSMPMGVVSMPNLNMNFVPFHVGEMSLYADPQSGSVCAAPSGFHMPFHVPFSGIISIPSAVLTQPIDSDAKGDLAAHVSSAQVSNAQVGNGLVSSAQLANAQLGNMSVNGVQLANAPLCNFGNPALFSQAPFNAAPFTAFVSQPFAFLGPTAMNNAALPNGTVALLPSMSQNGTMFSGISQNGALNEHFVPLNVTALPNTSASQSDAKLATNASIDASNASSNVEHSRHSSKKEHATMKNLDEIFALFTNEERTDDTRSPTRNNGNQYDAKAKVSEKDAKKRGRRAKHAAATRNDAESRSNAAAQRRSDVPESANAASAKRTPKRVRRTHAKQRAEAGARILAVALYYYYACILHTHAYAQRPVLRIISTHGIFSHTRSCPGASAKNGRRASHSYSHFAETRIVPISRYVHLIYVNVQLG